MNRTLFFYEAIIPLHKGTCVNNELGWNVFDRKDDNISLIVCFSYIRNTFISVFAFSLFHFFFFFFKGQLISTNSHFQLDTKTRIPRKLKREIFVEMPRQRNTTNTHGHTQNWFHLPCDCRMMMVEAEGSDDDGTQCGLLFINNVHIMAAEFTKIEKETILTKRNGD